MKKKILVVDDEVALTRMIKLNLERTGKFEVRTENLGEQTIPAAREFEPDLIFLDVMMPDMSGDDVAQELLLDDELKNIKIVFMTAIVTKKETHMLGSNIGGNEYLAKPVSVEDLLETIDRVLS